MMRLAGGTVLVILLAGLAWWQLKDDGRNEIRKELVLNIPDTGRIGEIEILDRDGQRVKLTRQEGYWMVNGRKARQHAINNLLSTIHDQRVSALVPSSALDNVVRDLGRNGVRFAVKGSDDESIMTFYVGGVTPDERGTFMLREGSEWPVIVNIPGFEGGLRSRYIMSELDWRSRQIINPVEAISKLIIDYPTRQEHSLILKETKDGFQVTPLYQPDTNPVPVHRYLVEAYMDLINYLYAEAILDDSRREVMDAATPFCRLVLTDGKGGVQKLEFYPKVWIDFASEVKKSEKVERYYTDYNDETIFLTQHLLMQKIFTGYEHFVSLKDFGQEQ